MPKTTSLTPSIKVAFYATQENFSSLVLATHSVTLGKAPHGAISDTINAALREYFINQKRPVPQE